jgi:hypothetical protein
MENLLDESSFVRPDNIHNSKRISNVFDIHYKDLVNEYHEESAKKGEKASIKIGDIVYISRVFSETCEENEDSES